MTDINQKITGLAKEALELTDLSRECQANYMVKLLYPEFDFNGEDQFEGMPWHKVLLAKLEIEDKLDLVEAELTRILKG